MSKIIKIKFVDFWDNFVPTESLFYKLLKDRYEIILSDENPDYIFYSVFGSEHLKFDCVRIFYTGENQAPDFNMADYAIGFETISFGDRYFRCPIYYLYTNDFMAMAEKHRISATILKQKKKFCSFVCSNNNASPEREVMLDLLNNYKTVSSGGRFRNNVGGPVIDKLAFQKEHKFSIAFENCSHEGYVTEKIVQSFAAGTIPIYWGDTTVCETFNKNSFINVIDYASFDEVVNVVKTIDENDDLFIKMVQTPALLHPEIDGYEPMLSKLIEFLFHIFDQPLETATRCSREYWGRRYMTRQRVLTRAYNHSLRGIAEWFYKKELWKIRKKNTFLWNIDRLIKRK